MELHADGDETLVGREAHRAHDAAHLVLRRHRCELGAVAHLEEEQLLVECADGDVAPIGGDGGGLHSHRRLLLHQRTARLRIEDGDVTVARDRNGGRLPRRGGGPCLIGSVEEQLRLEIVGGHGLRGVALVRAALGPRMPQAAR